MNFSEKRLFGSTGLHIGRLGIASSYGAPTQAFEEAFERGCNYFVWNTFLKGRSPRMREAIKNIVKSGKRDQLVIAMHSYGHNAIINKYFLRKSLKQLGVDYIDIMLLGYYSWKPARSVIDGALKLKEKGLIRFIGMTGHNRKLFPVLDKMNVFNVFHIRYNAVHRGAENDIFPHLQTENKTGIVSFTATRWGQLLDQKNMPEGVTAPTASDCYRFVLSNPSVDVCMTGPRTLEQMRENLKTLEMGPLSEEELAHMRIIGDHIHHKK
jgi:predicted aldo/keto reductase-like oxidoreductase